MSFDAVKVFEETKQGYLSRYGGYQDLASPSKRIPYTTYGDVMKFGSVMLTAFGGDFTKTANYNTARTRLQNALPTAKFSRAFVNTNIAATYPYNTEFWTAGFNLAVARGAAGMVPGTWSVIKESVSESVRDLVDKVPSIPGVDLLISIVKWTAVAGIAFFAWKYVGEPYLAKRKELGP